MKNKFVLPAIIISMVLTLILIINVVHAQVSYQTAPTFKVASSTTFTLTTTSKRLLATSTPTKRLAATIQPYDCTSNMSQLFIMMNSDVVAVADTGMVVHATTTQAFGDYPNTPVVQNSVQGIVDTGTCTVLVTEWRSQY